VKSKTIIFLLMFCLVFSSSVLVAQDGETLTGVIDNDSPFIEFPINVEEQGGTIVADIQALSGDLDTLLYLVDSNGGIVAENDDRVRGDTNSLLIFPQADVGMYTLIATRYKVERGDSTGEFELQVSVETGALAEEVTYLVSDEDLIAAGFPDIEVRAEAEWTILAYYGGDNNLEPGIINDFDEFEVAGGSSSQVQIVVLVDRNPGFTDSGGDWDTVRLFEVGADVSADHDNADVFPPTMDTEPLADLGEMETDNGETLAQFLIWAIRHYPSKHYVVAFGSHGAGWQGLITDDTSEDPEGHAILSIPELQTAFDLALIEAGVEKFDLLINDACLMSSTEYFSGIARYFNYSLASPEIVVDPALDMTQLTQLIADSGADVDLEAIGTTLVDTYITRDILLRESSDTVYLTHSITDLNGFPPVMAAVENFARVVNRNPALNADLLGNARSNAYTYTSFMGGNTRIDLGNLMRQVIVLSTDSAIIRSAARVLTALEDARVYANAGERAARRVSYYNIYFPDSSRDFKIRYFEEGGLQEWGRMLRNYYNAVTPQLWGVGGIGFHLPVAPQIKFVTVHPTEGVSLLAPTVMTYQAIGRGFAYGDFTIDQIQPDGTIIRKSTERVLTPSVNEEGETENINEWDSGVSVNDLKWDVTLPLVTNGEISHYESIIFTEDVVFLDGRYREPGSEVWNDVAVVFNRATGELQRIVNKSEGTDALAVIDIAPGSEFQVYSSVVTPDGRISPEPGNIYVWPEQGLSWQWSPAPNGAYDLGLLMTAFGGTTGFDSTNVSVNNDGVNPELRSENWPDLGNIIPRWSDWPWYTYFDDEGEWGYYRTNNEEKTENFTVYFAINDDLAPTAAAVAEYMLQDYGRELVSDIAEAQLSGMTVAEFEYTYESEDGTYRGIAFAYYIDSQAFGAVYAAEVLDGIGDLNKVYTTLRDEITLYNPDDEITDIRDWASARSRDRFVSEARYWIPKVWSGFEDGMWKRYAPDGDENSATFIAMADVTEYAGTEDASDILGTLVGDLILAEMDDFEIIGNRVYNAENHTWNAILYEGTRGENLVVGRFYATLVCARSYATWVETVNDDGAADVFNNIFEPIMDGFELRDTDPCPVGGDVISIDAASAEEEAVLLRYNRRSLMVYNRLPGDVSIDVSGLTFVQSSAEGDAVQFAASEWATGDVTALRSGDCYQVLMNYYTELPSTTFPTDVCVWRQGYRSTMRDFWTSADPEATFDVQLNGVTVATCPTVPEITMTEFDSGDVDYGEEVRCLASLD
jgi:hypothetical protein